MKQLLTAALMVLTGLWAQAQNSETRNTNPFTGIDAANGIEVIYTQSGKPLITVESDSKNCLQNIITEVKGGTLKVYMRNPESRNAATAKVYVSQENVQFFKAATGASIKVNGKVVMDETEISLASGATFCGEIVSSSACSITAASGSVFRGIVSTDAFDASVTGGASIKLSGKANSSTVYCKSGTYAAGKFMSGTADINALNASSAYVNAADSIKANSDSSSSVTYYGNPAKVDLGENTYAIKRDTHRFALN